MKYEKWSFGYWCLKQYVKFADWLIYKRIIISGREKIPKNKPIVFAPNHQNALCDPMAVLLHTHFQPVWLARADIFKSKTVSKILRFMKIMPVYRLRDGKENLDKNDQTFADSIKVLQNNFALALFPEAAHSGKRKMLSHKKAVPRIVFMTEEKENFNMGIQIIPVGIYYSHYWKFNRTLIVNFGNPVEVKPFYEKYKSNPNATINELRNKIYDAIHPLVIDIRSKKFYNDFEQIREVYGCYFLKKQQKVESPINRFCTDQALTKKLDQLENENPSILENIVKQLHQYLRLLKKHKIKSWVVEQKGVTASKTILNAVLLLAGLPVFIFGFVFNAIPFFTIDRLVRKKVKDQTFWSTFFLIGGIILFPLVYLLEFFAVAWLLPNLWLKLLFLLSLPFAGKLAFKWYVLYRKFIGRCRFLFLKLFRKKDYSGLIAEREALFNQLDNAIVS